MYDGFDIVLVYDASSSLTNRYLHGPTVDQMFADEDALGDVLWSLPDNQGTIRDQLDNDGVKENHLKYDAYGNITAQSNSSIDVLYAYTGREWDPDAELYYYRARWYDPAVGRFISEDPIGFAAGDANLSRYVSNSSLNFRDPTGTTAQSGPADRLANSVHTYRSLARTYTESNPNPARQQQAERQQYADMYEAWLTGFEATGGMDALLRPIEATWGDVFGQIFLGEISEYEPTAAGTTGSVALGLTGVDVYKDVVDISHGLANWEWSWEHTGNMALNAVALLPVIGAVKNLKHADELADATKSTSKLLDTRRVRNPWGSSGAPDHQAAVKDLVKDFKKKYPRTEGYEVRSNQSIFKESAINRRPDAAALKDGMVVAVGEVARTNKNGSVVSREAKKLMQYSEADIPAVVVTLPK